MNGSRITSALSTIAVCAITALAFTSCPSVQAPEASALDTQGMDDKLSTPIVIKGYEEPESVLYDAKNDVYLVSVIDGFPLGEDNNGYISKVSPKGKILQQRWIQGGVNGVELDAPKGSTIVNGILYVADINDLRKFDLRTGRPLGSIHFPGAGLLNDVASDRYGNVYMSDIGFKPNAAANGIEPSGSDAIYKITPRDTVTVVAQGNALLHHPNGLAVLPNGKLQVLSFDPFDGTKEIYTIDMNGQKANVVPMPVGLLDGVVVLGKCGLLVSSWETGSIYLVKPDGAITVVASGFNSPADIGWDTRRERVLVPENITVADGSRVVIQSLDLH